MNFHTNLPVMNINKTVEFYSVLFDEAPVKVKADYAKYLPKGLSLNIGFHQTSSGPGILSQLHLGFELPTLDALNVMQARLEEAGLVSEARETSICCYANQDKFWVEDPDGYKWELYVLLEDTETKIDKKTSCCGGGASSPVSKTDCC